jgi:hypothetical protein
LGTRQGDEISLPYWKQPSPYDLPGNVMNMNNDNSTQCHFDVEELQTIADNFHRDGFVHVPAVLSGDLVEDLKKKTAELLDDPELAARENLDLHDTRYALRSRATPVPHSVLRSSRFTL